MVVPKTDGTCPSCHVPFQASAAEAAAVTAARAAAERPGARPVAGPPPFWTPVFFGTLAVSAGYVVGSAISWQTDGADEIGDLRLLQHVGSLIGFFFAGRLARARWPLAIGLILIASFYLTGWYEDTWRGIAWSSGYLWGAHYSFVPVWILAAAIGGWSGRISARRPRAQEIVKGP